MTGLFTTATPPLTLRYYQAQAVAAVYDHLRNRDDNPCVVIPTAGGKTAVMASICRDAVQLWHGRVLVLAHVKELLEQTYTTLSGMAGDLDIGLYSAGLGRRDTDHSIIVAGIQSVYKRADELGAFPLILIDESHLIPPDGDGMYQRFLADMQRINPQVRLVGFTATPYRMSTGTICGPDNLLNHICYEVGVRELIVQGYLCPLRSKAGRRTADTSGLHLRGGEFINAEVEAIMDDESLVKSACREIVELTTERHSVLLFASGVQHAIHIQQELESRGHECGFVCGETLPFDRASTLQRFKDGDLKYLVNVNVLTTGFDAPNIDCVVLLRPTNSPGLYYQMLGRGFRLHDSKSDCLVLDYGGNLMRHGPVDTLQAQDRTTGTGQAPAKVCPECREVIHAAYQSCPECGHEFPRERANHDAQAANEGVLSGEVTESDYQVMAVFYRVHTKRGADEDAPKTMRVDYQIALGDYQSEWVCPEHTGYARSKFEAWWRNRSHAPLPETAAEAVDMAQNGALADVHRITVRRVTGERFDRIVDCQLGDKPDYREPGWDQADEPAASPSEIMAGYIDEDDDIPF